MSERFYAGRWSDAIKPSPFRIVPWLIFLVSIGLMIAWVLLTGDDRHPFTIGIVTTTALAVFVWSLRSNGPIWTFASFLTIFIFTYLLELIGVNTGIPFGQYEYTDSLGFQLAEVPVVVPLAWYSMAIPTLMIARSLSKRKFIVVMMATIGLTAWDFLLDPWMVAEGHWVWQNPEPSLPGLTGIPITNFIGWLISTFLLFLILDLFPRRRVIPLALPIAIYSWQWIGGAFSNLVFLDNSIVAFYVFFAMALLAVPAIFTQYVKYR
jgi:putative membrane protein